jgi:TonB-linked SusC/RagA family outer membrane protein
VVTLKEIKASVPIPTTQEILINVTGRVVDENNKPLPGATASVKGQANATMTDKDGLFTLTEVQPKATIVINFIGYDKFELSAKPDLGQIKLRVSSNPLDEVQVIAYGKISKRLNTGNVVTVKAADIEKQPVTNPLLALIGRVPGMEITQANGLPGSGVTVRIRGQNSINNGNDPLYVIDGVPYLSQMLHGLGNITGGSGAPSFTSAGISGSPLNYINPGDIESIDVLKDADATAIYGTRGANGVVLITTKKGKAGPMRIDVNMQQGWSKVIHFTPWLNTREYLDMRYEAYKNDGVDIKTLQPQGDNYDLTLWDTTRYTDWNKEMIGGIAKYSNLQVALYGGSNNIQYRVGYNYNKQTTVFPGSFGDPKSSVSFSLGSTSDNKKLHLQFTGNYQADKNELPNYDFSNFVSLAPDAPSLRNPDGSLNWAIDPATGNETWNNPIASLNDRYKRKVNNLLTNAVLSYQILPGLEIKTTAGYTDIRSEEVIIHPLSSVAPSAMPFFRRVTNFANSQSNSWIIEPQLTYQTKIAGGALNALIGTTIQQNDSEGQAISAIGFDTDLVMDDIKAAKSLAVNGSLDAVYKYNAIYGRLNYNYNDEYLVNLTGRRDGTSRFGPGKQFANFGAVGLGWIFSKKNFIKANMPFLSFGKIRGSYGTTGSDQVGDYRFLDLYNYQNYTLPQNYLSLVLNGVFNTDLAWEETRKVEAAIELGFLQDRITLSASYYHNRSSNQLTDYQLPGNTGVGSVPANLSATVQNAGWEFTVNTINLQSGAVRWTSSVNLSIPRNKLVSLGSDANNIDKRLIGLPLSTQFVYGFAGVDPATGRYQFYDNTGGLTFRPDTAHNATGFPANVHAINQGAQLLGGLQNSVSWKNFQLDFSFQFTKQFGTTYGMGNYPGAFYNANPESQNQPVLC